MDAVGTFLMGYDPGAEYPKEPFCSSQNHLIIARDLGLGPIDLGKIDIRLGKGVSRLEELVTLYSVSYARYNIPADLKPEKVNRIPLDYGEKR